MCLQQPQNLPNQNHWKCKYCQVLLNQIEQLEKRRRRTMVSKAIKPRPIRVLDRGDWMDEGGPVVEPNVPGILPSLSTVSDSGPRRATRLDLAQWLFEENRPLTARVFVNRIWYLFFNSGLSSSLEDSGNQGEWPTHPELLDALTLRTFGSVTRRVIDFLLR